MATKFYCYVDETGQDTWGEFFLVAVVVIGEDRNVLIARCEQLEDESGKGKAKWGRAEKNLRLQYIQRILADSRFHESLRYCVFHQIRDYDTAIVEAIAKAVFWANPPDDYAAYAYIDGLSKTKRREYGPRLRKLGLSVKKVRGVARDENNALIRLADAVAGFVRDALEEQSGELKNLFDKAMEERVLIDVGK